MDNQLHKTTIFILIALSLITTGKLIFFLNTKTLIEKIII